MKSSLIRSLILVAGASLVPMTATAEYYAETGRTAHITVPDAMVRTQSGTTSESAESAPVFTISPAELYAPELARALEESGVDMLGVQSDGVNTSLRTWAEIQTYAILGKPYLKLEDGTKIPSLYLALAMVYQNQLWVRAPILPVESRVLGELLQVPYGKGVRVAPTAIMRNKTARTLVMAALTDNQAQLAGLSDKEKKILRRFASHLAAFLNLPGELRLVPMPSDPSLWISPQHISRPELLQSSELAEQVRALNLQSEPYKSVMALDRALREAFETRSADGLKSKQEAAFAALTKTEGYLSPALLRLDHFKTGLKPYKQASYVFLAAFLAFLAYLVSTRRPKSLDSTSDNSHNGTTAAVSSRTLEPAPAQAMASAPILGSMARQELALAGGPPLSGGGEPIFFRREIESVDEVLKAEQEVSSGNRLLWTIAYGILTFGCLLLLGALIARFALGGRMPVSNMFEAVTFALTSFALLAVIAEGIIRRGWIGISGAFLGWTLMMAVNLMPMNAKKVEPLIAVLDSIWLNYHVTSLLISYSCFLLAFAFSVIQIVKLRFGNRAGLLPRAEVFEHLAFRSTQVGWPLLTLGIFLGAVWANTAWGSYWSWDPKETWALITFFGYTIYLHMRMIVGWNGEKAAWLNIVGFVLVLITFFGVSYLPGLAGGMHSYANPISR